MRLARSALTLSVLLLAIPSWGKQTPQTASTPQTPSDPQAVAVVQAAITALGGATAIGEAQSWTLQASVQGPTANGNFGYTLSTAMDTTAYTPLPNGLRKPGPLIRSLFVPVAVGSILLAESQDTTFFFTYRGPMTIGAKSITVIDFHVASVPFPVQTWCFDASTNLPISINFRMSAQIGQRISSQGIVDLSDYRTVSGVLYPFQISTHVARSLFLELITLQSVAPSTTVIQNDYNSAAGDLI